MSRIWKKLLSATATCLAVSAFTTPSWSQTPTVSVNNPVTYAKELFAGSANPTLTTGSSTNTTVDLVYDFSANGIDANATGDFTFSFSNGGATFATAATVANFTYSGGSADTVSIAVQGASGSIGSSTVTYRVTATTALASANSTFTFTLPDITGANNANGLGRTAPVRNPDAANSESDLILCVQGAAGTGANTFAAYPRQDFVVASSKYAFTMEQMFRTATTTARVINPGDRRTLIDETDDSLNDVYDVTVGGETSRAVALSTLVVTNVGNVKDAGGETDLAPDGTNDMLNVAVTGSFTDDEILFFSPDTTMSSGEQLTVAAMDASPGASFALAAGTWTLYYVPDGVTPISQKLIETEYTIDLQQSSDGYYDQMLEPLPVTLLLHGVVSQGYAYAVPHPDDADRANVRIRCQEGVESCEVYFDCKTGPGLQFGNDGNGTLPSITIPGGGLVTLQPWRPAGHTNSFADVIGVDRATWVADRRVIQRISCNILSTNEIAIQVLTRSGGVLVNNTYVGGQLINK